MNFLLIATLCGVALADGVQEFDSEALMYSIRENNGDAFSVFDMGNLKTMSKAKNETKILQGDYIIFRLKYHFGA